jgi:hypothetical protein
MLHLANPDVPGGKTVVLDLHYLPSIPYFVAIAGNRKVVIDLHEHFVKQTYRNRCRILTAGGTRDLVIPVKRPHQHVPFNEIRIDNRQKWAKNHWSAIQSAYGKSPWFTHYSEGFKSIILGRQEFICDLNIQLLDHCLNVLGVNTRIEFTTEYRDNWGEGYLDLRSVILPKKSSDNLSFYRPEPYIQNFGVNFVQSLSIIDLIFSEGPVAGNLILHSFSG